MTRRDWSSIHGEVKEDESMKSHSGGVGSRNGTKQRGEKLMLLSLAFFIIYIYAL